MSSTQSSFPYFQSLAIVLLATGISIAQIDPGATPATKNLYAGLKRSAEKGVMFGQQDALAYGLNADKSRWIGDKDRSDIKTITGEHPAVVGYDLGHIELDSVNNLDGVPFSRIKEDIRINYERGGVNTISWHPNNPVNFSKTTWDKEEFTIRKIMSDEKNKKRFEKTLDKLADFFLSLKGSKGELIPVIFRHTTSIPAAGSGGELIIAHPKNINSSGNSRSIISKKQERYTTC